MTSLDVACLVMAAEGRCPLETAIFYVSGTCSHLPVFRQIPILAIIDIRWTPGTSVYWQGIVCSTCGSLPSETIVLLVLVPTWTESHSLGQVHSHASLLPIYTTA